MQDLLGRMPLSISYEIAAMLAAQSRQKLDEAAGRNQRIDQAAPQALIVPS